MRDGPDRARRPGVAQPSARARPRRALRQHSRGLHYPSLRLLPSTLVPAGVDLGTLRVGHQVAIEARFDIVPDRWFAAEVAWHADGHWRAARSIRSDGGRSFLFVDAAMHGALHARCTPPARPPGTACWGLIIRHYNDGNHLPTRAAPRGRRCEAD